MIFSLFQEADGQKTNNGCVYSLDLVFNVYNNPVKTKQDLFIRLIDSQTKQVSVS